MLTCANTMQMNATGPRGLVRRQHGGSEMNCSLWQVAGDPAPTASAASEATRIQKRNHVELQRSFLIPIQIIIINLRYIQLQSRRDRWALQMDLTAMRLAVNYNHMGLSLPPPQSRTELRNWIYFYLSNAYYMSHFVLQKQCNKPATALTLWSHGSYGNNIDILNFRFMVKLLSAIQLFPTDEQKKNTSYSKLCFCLLRFDQYSILAALLWSPPALKGNDATLCNSTLHYATLLNTTLRCTTLYYTAPHYTIL